MLMSTNGQMHEIHSLQSEPYDTNTIKIYSTETIRSALLDIKSMSVYLFNGNRRIIATERMRDKTIVAAMDLCKVWVYDGIYNESDFAA